MTTRDENSGHSGLSFDDFMETATTPCIASFSGCVNSLGRKWEGHRARIHMLSAQKKTRHTEIIGGGQTCNN